jgi:membrane protein implicated in regulation of membrane protease activity
LAFFIVPVATVGSVALAVALFYVWRCWRDRKRRPVRPSALNIVGIEA